MYVLYKDPPSRPIASGNTGQNLHMSELTSDLRESVVRAYEGGVESISTEDMLAKWDALNERNAGWKPGTWWDGYEEDGLITCGTCMGEDESMPRL